MQVDDGDLRVDEPAPDPVADNFGERRWFWITVAVLIAVATGFVIDERQRDRETEQLLRAVESGQATVRHAEQLVAATVTYATPALVLSQTPEPARADLVGLVEDAAADAAAAVRRVRGQATAVEFWPWHRELDRAQQAYLAYLGGRESRFAAASADIWTLAEVDEMSADLRESTSAALRAAAGPDSAGEVDRLFP
jgi:hypothetical protein